MVSIQSVLLVVMCAVRKYLGIRMRNYGAGVDAPLGAQRPSEVRGPPLRTNEVHRGEIKTVGTGCTVDSPGGHRG